MIGRRAVYAGRVQSVGFRQWLKESALGFEVTGRVRNLADGRVELTIYGVDSEVNEYLRAVENGQMRGAIRGFEVHAVKWVACRDFQILP